VMTSSTWIDELQFNCCVERNRIDYGARRCLLVAREEECPIK